MKYCHGERRLSEVEFSLFPRQSLLQVQPTVALIVHDILDATDIEVIPLNNAIFLASLALYEQRLDRGYSMVDYLSMQVMKSRGLARVLTHDKHFTQEGFQILL